MHHRDLVIAQAEADHNCAWNAFILALTQPEIFATIEESLNGLDPNAKFKSFIKKAAAELGVTQRWSAVRNKMLALKRRNPVALQKSLAPVMREVFYEEAPKLPRHYIQTELTLEVAFDAYKNDLVYEVADDICAPHDFIQVKFAQLKFDERLKLSALNNKLWSEEETQIKKSVIAAETLATLKLWWAEEGYHQFLYAMKQNGEWSGDLELEVIAHYFNTQVDVIRANQPVYSIAFDVGRIRRHESGLTEAEISQLHLRGIIDKPESATSDLILLDLPKEEVEKRLNSVGQEVIFYVSHRNFVAKKIIPAAWDDETVAQLIARGVLNRENINENNFSFQSSLSKAEIKRRLCALPRRIEILNMWERYYKPHAKLTLINDAVHWDALVYAPKESSQNRYTLFGQATSTEDADVFSYSLDRKHVAAWH